MALLSPAHGRLARGDAGPFGGATRRKRAGCDDERAWPPPSRPAPNRSSTCTTAPCPRCTATSCAGAAATAAGRGPDVGDVPGRGRRLPAGRGAPAHRRLAGGRGPQQAGRPLAPPGGRGAPARGRGRARPDEPSASTRASSTSAGRWPCWPGWARTTGPRSRCATSTACRRAPGGRRARPHGARHRGPARAGPPRVPHRLRPTRGERRCRLTRSTPCQPGDVPLEPRPEFRADCAAPGRRRAGHRRGGAATVTAAGPAGSTTSRCRPTTSHGPSASTPGCSAGRRRSTATGPASTWRTCSRRWASAHEQRNRGPAVVRGRRRARRRRPRAPRTAAGRRAAIDYESGWAADCRDDQGTEFSLSVPDLPTRHRSRRRGRASCSTSRCPCPTAPGPAPSSVPCSAGRSIRPGARWRPSTSPTCQPDGGLDVGLPGHAPTLFFRVDDLDAAMATVLLARRYRRAGGRRRRGRPRHLHRRPGHRLRPVRTQPRLLKETSVLDHLSIQCAQPAATRRVLRRRAAHASAAGAS